MDAQARYADTAPDWCLDMVEKSWLDVFRLSFFKK